LVQLAALDVVLDVVAVVLAAVEAELGPTPWPGRSTFRLPPRSLRGEQPRGSLYAVPSLTPHRRRGRRSGAGPVRSAPHRHHPEPRSRAQVGKGGGVSARTH